MRKPEGLVDPHDAPQFLIGLRQPSRRSQTDGQFDPKLKIQRVLAQPEPVLLDRLLRPTGRQQTVVRVVATHARSDGAVTHGEPELPLGLRPVEIEHRRSAQHRASLG